MANWFQLTSFPRRRTWARCARAEEEQKSCHLQCGATSEAGGKHSAEETADDAADEGTGAGYAVEDIGVDKICGTEEEGLQTLFCTADDSGVVSEEKTSDDCYEDNAVKIKTIGRCGAFHGLFVGENEGEMAVYDGTCGQKKGKIPTGKALCPCLWGINMETSDIF